MPPASSPKSIGTDGIAPMRLKREDIRQGAVVSYLGDDVAFATPWLNKKSGPMKMLSYRDSANSITNLPTKKGTRFEISRIETDRFGKANKNGKRRKLEDMVVLTTEELPDHVAVVGYADTLAKFGFVAPAPSFADIDDLNETAANNIAPGYSDWKKNIEMEGWG